MPIHRTAVVDVRAEIHPDADIGPCVVVDGPVKIGAGTRVLAHATLTGHTEIGSDNVIHMGAVVGHVPQDLAFDGRESYLRLGDRNVIREHAQLHRGTKPGSATVVGNDNYFMCNAHVGHNCRIGNRVILTNGALLGGYVEVDDLAVISGNSVVHQHVRVGRLALLRGGSRTSRDVPPFCIMEGTHTVRAINRVGLRRAGYTASQIRALHAAFRTLFHRARNLSIAVAELEAGPCSEEVRQLLEFIRASQRGVCRGRRRAEVDED
jgi:UDP-N-acetylglucosamine acyltransferase